MTIHKNSLTSGLGLVNVDQGVIRVNEITYDDMFFRISDPAEQMYTLFFAKETIQISRILSVKSGSGNTTFTMYYDTARNGDGNKMVEITANNSANGLVTTTFERSVIPKDSWVWIDITDVSGSVSELCLVLNY